MKVSCLVAFVASHEFYIPVETDLQGVFGWGESSAMQPTVL